MDEFTAFTTGFAIGHPTSVRHCYGSAPGFFEVDSEEGARDSQADQFGALAQWLAEHGDSFVNAINVKTRDDGSSYLEVFVTPVRENKGTVVYGPETETPCVSTGREFFEIVTHRGGRVAGLIPRVVCESLGVDCSPVDREPRGTIWFTKEQSDAIHAHPEWEPV